MDPETETFGVPLDGYTMHLRRSELSSVAAGLGELNAARLVEAVRALPATDRAPLWELAVRRYGRRKPLEQAAGEIGMDVIRGRELLDAWSRAISDVAPPEINS